MNALVVFHSEYGNTRQVAEAIVEVFQGTGPVQALSAVRLTASELRDADLVVMGTPTHKMKLPEAVQPVFEKLPRRVLRGVPVAAFDTSYRMSGFLARFTAAKRLDGKLRKLGGKRTVPPETFHVEHHHEGPLCDGEIDRARSWAKSILAQLERQDR